MARTRGRDRRPRILVVTRPDDEHAVAVALALEEVGLRIVPVDLRALASHGLAIALRAGRPPGVVLRGGSGPVDPASCVAAWWRRPSTPEPPRRAGAGRRRLWDAEWTAALRGLARVMPGRWVNDPGREEVARLKLVQLEAARAVGLDVPRTLVTNDLRAARAFIGSCRSGAVLKSLSSVAEGGATRAASARSAWLPARLATGPAILQERLHGLDLRVTVVGRRLFAAVADARAGDSPTDVREGWWEAAAAGGPYRLPRDLARRLLALTRRLGLLYAAIDLRRRSPGSGEWTFLEVNPGGQWLHVEATTGHPITAALARLLAGPHAPRKVRPRAWTLATPISPSSRTRP